MLTLNKRNIWAYSRINEHRSLYIVICRVVGIQHRFRDVRNIFLVRVSLVNRPILAVVALGQFSA